VVKAGIRHGSGGCRDTHSTSSLTGRTHHRLLTVHADTAPDGGEHGDAARSVLPDVVNKSHDRLCTVGRTIEIGTPIAARIE
jgi:hypothetical protein